MITRATLSAALMVLLQYGSASAQVAAVPRPPSTPGASSHDAAAHSPRKGIPGFYHPTTGTFTPLAAQSSAAPVDVIGSAEVLIVIVDTYSKRNGGTIFGLVKSNFGRLQSSQATRSAATAPSFAPLQYTEASTNFPTNEKSQTVSTNFVTNYPLFQARVTCNESTATVSYSTSIFVAQQAPKSGTTKLTATCNL